MRFSHECILVGKQAPALVRHRGGLKFSSIQILNVYLLDVNSQNLTVLRATEMDTFLPHVDSISSSTGAAAEHLDNSRILDLHIKIVMSYLVSIHATMPETSERGEGINHHFVAAPLAPFPCLSLP
jgi:hypothetical protein